MSTGIAIAIRGFKQPPQNVSSLLFLSEKYPAKYTIKPILVISDG